MDVSALKRDLEGLKVDDNPAIVQQKSRDFYWYSPVLKQQLDHVTGDLIVTPKNEAELIRVLAASHRHGVPVTPRGSGTGNYGQAMPLSGGVVLNLAEMNEIKSIAPGRVVTGPGAILADIDKATRAHSGQELRLSPSTYNTASIGGFIAGGSGGIGSINFGGLRDFGNVLRLRVVTMEAEPKALELTGADLHKVTHAYGTNGIISEVEMPLTAAYDWIDVIVGFDAFMDAARYGNALACQDGILTKLITPIAAPVPQLYFKRHQKFLSDGQSICVVMVAQHGLDAFLAFTRRAGGEVIYNAATATPDEKKGLPPAYELAWNHTTLRALRVDPSITYLQSLYPFPNQLALVEKMDAMFPGEVFSHLEFVRLDGNITCFGLPLVKFTTEARLDEIVRLHEANGCPIFNPHRYTLEEGGMKQTDAVQLAFKRQTDPQGLLNPGKMIAWENPDYDYRSGRTFLFRGLQKVG
ncbi:MULTISPECIES: FAD-binding oxidoreductase [Mesorhizobium]|uniref:FAD linked oxidase domain protein n=2 Tax=Mesorhizobium TaxID=68287 RepID=E8TI65_MESCW|nr:MULTISPECIES: FAD-binding oxidoreductase [Mesorhizobium]RUZ91811.1 FAD-binding oxidoreductase [Mesorhizobium sp. M7A.F.Ca.US.003.02.2.1]ADV12449.1 FAD linked oxidase domain protein [Mesorhizobium ciceri biovar biserrulae WSM1271]RUY95383.1 FAD-binding oxidoreductase [Mesorhizobium sp. M7A.F.Ca.CA.001.12.2.1]RUZ24020.1 FAD-binding oxidoreductase [Mesorhizobium sp. M7A.F.Ca.US.007.01.2.1]RUZ47833.1 FAD-binding oxidoreductase [Mesorhizobium sp. M7A.F.Ca.US.003.02.1.1]